MTRRFWEDKVHRSKFSSRLNIDSGRTRDVGRTGVVGRRERGIHNNPRRIWTKTISTARPHLEVIASWLDPEQPILSAIVCLRFVNRKEHPSIFGGLDPQPN